MTPLLWLLACAPQGEVPPDDTTDSELIDSPGDTPAPAISPLDPRRLLIRASLDLRGVRPTTAELDAVDADPSTLDATIATFVRDPRFGRRVREVFDEVYQMRDEATFIDQAAIPGRATDAQLWEAMGEEPTRMLERIANEDLPYTELVTADWTMANEVSGAIFPTDYPAGQTGWRVARYTDGRPAAGALVSNGFWWHHGSTANNLNRGRANHVSRIYLCADYLDGAINFSVSGLDSSASLGEAIRDNPSCASCHDSLDPLAANLFGFWYPLDARSDFLDIRAYHPERERLWSDLGGLSPALHGAPTAGLADLGQRIADDESYARCFIKRSWEGLLRRPLTPAETPVINEVMAPFVASGLHIRDAWLAIVRSELWRQGTGDGAPRVASPALLSSEIEDLTGFRWTEGGWDLIRAPLTGYAPLAGGVDGDLRFTAYSEPTSALVLVQSQLAIQAAATVAEHDLADPTHARLLTRVTADESRDEVLRAQLVDLHARITGERVTADDPRLDDEIALWTDMRDQAGDPAKAWAAVLTVLLRDPNVVVF